MSDLTSHILSTLAVLNPNRLSSARGQQAAKSSPYFAERFASIRAELTYLVQRNCHKASN
jgi:hypothetical protein